MVETNILDYKIEISRVAEDDGGGYTAYMPELGCIGDGDTIENAIKDVQEVAENLIKLAIEDGRTIPRSKIFDEENYSGKLSLRIPKSLHKMLAKQSEIEECSINQLITTYISMGLGKEFGKTHFSISLQNNEARINTELTKSVMSLWNRSQDFEPFSRT